MSSSQSYSHYMRPQDRGGSNCATSRGRSPHQHQASSLARSRGRSHENHRHYERDMRVEARRDQYHRSWSIDYAPHSRGHRSRSFDPHANATRHNYSSSSNNSSQRNSSYHEHSSRKRSRSPYRPNHRYLQNNEYERSSRPRSFGHGRPKDTRYERRPLGPTNGNGAEMHRAPANEFHRNKHTENYDNASYDSDMNNMNNYRSHYYQPPSRYDHPKSTSQMRRPIASPSRQYFASNPQSWHQSNPTMSQNVQSAPRFNNNHTIPELSQIAYTNLAAMTPPATAAFWNKVSKQMSGRNASKSRLPSQNEKLSRHLTQIFEHTTSSLSLFGSMDLSQTIYSMAKIVNVLRRHGGRRRGDDIIDMLSGLLMKKSDMTTPKRSLFLSFACASRDKLDNSDAWCLSNIAYAYALIKYVPEFDDGSDLFQRIATQAARRRVEFTPQGISNMMWAYATVDKPHALLFEAMGDQIVAREHLGEFKPQELSNTVWAYAKAGISHPKLFEKVANHVARIDVLYGFKPQALSNIAWAYAKAGVCNSSLFEKVANNIVGQDNLDAFIPQHLSNTVWAYAKAGFNHPELFEKVADHIVESKSLARFNSQDLSNTMWAYAKAGSNHSRLFEKVANHIVESDSSRILSLQQIDDRFIPQHLSNILWAYATAQFSHPNLFKKVAEAAIQSKGKFISQEVANLLWSYATMGIAEKQLYLSFVPTAANLIDSCNDQHLANIAWAYAVADVDAPLLFNGLFIKKCVEMEGRFEIEHYRQLYQWYLWQTKEKSHSGLSLDLQERCFNAFISDEPRVSKLQGAVVAQLSHIGLDPKEEVLMDSGYRIDAIVEVNGKTVGVEVDGPSHFIGRSKSPTGSTILKRRQVPLIDDIELVSVPYWEWDKLGNDEVKKQDYLWVLLEL
eukprot:scaffold8343_cov94-Skeletonema_dohrnii-CCMP3373.AAC.2